MRPIPYLSDQPVDDFGLSMANHMYDTLLAASTEQTLTVPGDAPRYKAVLSFGASGDVWVGVNNTATEPGGAFAATQSRLNPRCIEVRAGDELHFISANANTPVSVAFYALRTNS